MTQMAGNSFKLVRSNPRMITKNIGLLVFMILLAAGCRDREAEIRRAKAEAEIKARAAEARKEMDALPKAFKSPPVFRLNEPKKTPDVVAPAAKNPAP